MNNDRNDDTPILDGLEADQALLHQMSEKVAFWSMVAGHLLQRLEAMDPKSCVSITPKFKNIALGLPIQMGISQDETGDTYHLFVESDRKSVMDIRVHETERRKANGIGIEVVIKAGPREIKSGLVGIDGRELPAAERKVATDTRGLGTTGEIP